MEVIKGYTLLKPLSLSGRVVLAKRNDTKNLVVIKKDKLINLEREYRALQSCASDGICKVSNFVKENLLLELVYYPNVRTLLSFSDNDYKLLPEIFQKVITLLDYCHHCGYIHGDIKPSNILISPSNKVMLIDFGASLPIGTLYASLESYQLTPMSNVGMPKTALPIVDWQALYYYLNMVLAQGYSDIAKELHNVQEILAKKMVKSDFY